MFKVSGSISELLFFLRGRFPGPNIDRFDLYPGQFTPVADCAVISFAPPVFERDDFLVFPLFENFSSHLCPGNDGVALRHVVPVGKHQHIAETCVLADLHIEKIDIDRVAFRDAKLSATGSDDCVSHSFSGEKKPAKVP